MKLPLLIMKWLQVQPRKGVQLPLSMTTVGDRVWVVSIKGGHRMTRRLMDVGIVQR